MRMMQVITHGIRFLVFSVMQKGVLFNIKKITNILIGQST